MMGELSASCASCSFVVSIVRIDSLKCAVAMASAPFLGQIFRRRGQVAAGSPAHRKPICPVVLSGADADRAALR